MKASGVAMKAADWSEAEEKILELWSSRNSESRELQGYFHLFDISQCREEVNCQVTAFLRCLEKWQRTTG